MTLARFAHFDDVTVRFVEQPPSEEVVHYARRCAKERWLAGPLTVVVAKSQGTRGSQHHVLIKGPGHASVSESGANVLLAVREAFDRFELSADAEQAH